jgi:immune inhibitor A
VLLATTPADAARRVVPRRGELRLLVVLADFPDRAIRHGRDYFAGTPGALVDRLVAYYDEVSSGRLHIVPHVAQARALLPRLRATYVNKPGELARDALAAFTTVAAEPADLAALREADGALVFFAGPGRESQLTGGDPGDPWSNYTSVDPPLPVDGAAPVAEACVIAEEEQPPFSGFGVLCHEFGHLLGLPELYAPGNLPQEGIGVWGLMGQGTWVDHGDRPPHLDAWSKLRLGWVDVATITETTRGVVLPAVTRAPRVVRIPALPDRRTEYYLLENRRREGADAKLPGEGILVWHVDERVGGFRSAQTHAAHKLLHLVEADGRGDLDRGHAAGGNRGDAGDPWRGPPRWRRAVGGALALLGALALAAAVLRGVRPRPLLGVLVRLGVAGAALAAAGATLRVGPVCGPGTPGMAPYGGGPGRVVLRNFSPAAPEMSLDVVMMPARTDQIDSSRDAVRR